MNIDKNKISLDEDYLKEDPNQIFEIVKRINSIFIDDYDVPVHELPSPNDTRMMYYKQCINIQHLFRVQYDLPNDKQSGKLLFQIYLARLFSHYIINAYKKKIALDNEKKLVKSEEAKKKKKKSKKEKKKQTNQLEIEIERKSISIENKNSSVSISPTLSYFSNQSFEDEDYFSDLSEQDNWITVGSPKSNNKNLNHQYIGYNDELSFGSEEYSPEKKNNSSKCTSPIGYELKKNLSLNFFDTTTPFTFTSSLHSILNV